MTPLRPRIGLIILTQWRNPTPATRLLFAHYATQQRPATPTVNDPIKGALTAVRSSRLSDPINAPRSTLPPPLDLPTRGDENVALYYFRVGRAYGGFYKNGIKAVWNNWTAAKLLKEQTLKGAKVEDAVRNGQITRAEFQLLARSGHDVGKLPFFGVLVLIFGEWLPLLVPFIPHAVPGTCRIPKQMMQMQTAAEARRARSFRQGVAELGEEQLPTAGMQLGGKEEQSVEAGQTEWSMAYNAAYRSRLLKALRSDQLLHLSTTLGLHGNTWDKLQVPPPSLLLRRRISAHLAHLAQDDVLLLRHRGKEAHLAAEELHLACTARGLDVLGKKDGDLCAALTAWSQRQHEDKGAGRAMMMMLFRRPNAWGTKAGLNRDKKAK